MLPVESMDCPYCGEPIDLLIDDSVEHQEYIEDCPVCCRPINVEVSIGDDDEIQLSCSTDTDG